MRTFGKPSICLKVEGPDPFTAFVELHLALRQVWLAAWVGGFVSFAGIEPSSAETSSSSSTGGTTVTGQTRSVDEIPTWAEQRIVLTVDPTYMALPYAMEALEGAVKAWTDAASELPDVDIVEASTEGSPTASDANAADHRIWYAPDGDSRAGEALAITLLTLNSDRELLDADIIVNGGYQFTDCTQSTSSSVNQEDPEDDDPVPSSAYDLQNVITHELGHWFGLGESYDNPEATMYAYVVPNETNKRDLDTEDIDLAQAAYWRADNADLTGCSIGRPSPRSKVGCIGLWAVALFWLRRANHRGRTHVAQRAGRHS